jgi:hypothetical protein
LDLPIDNGVYNLYTSIMINNTMFNPNQLPNPTKLVMTQGVQAWLNEQNFPIYLLPRIIATEYFKQPDVCTDGGNDKRFFTVTSRNQKFFVAENEVNGLTIMLPEEY